MPDTTNMSGLRILAADEDESTLRATDELLAGLGHEVVAHAVTPTQAAELIARDDPDLSIVVVHDDDAHALDLIEEISEYARGPLIVLLGSHESHFVSSAAERGIDAFARPQFDEEVQGAIDLVMKRHTEKARLVEQVEQLESALERRGTIERAKGILMERHGVDERHAFELMRQHARRSNRRVVELAHAVADGHALLPHHAE
jgi:AmiR/NasT family two-component response regulator